MSEFDMTHRGVTPAAFADAMSKIPGDAEWAAEIEAARREKTRSVWTEQEDDFNS